MLSLMERRSWPWEPSQLLADNSPEELADKIQCIDFEYGEGHIMSCDSMREVKIQAGLAVDEIDEAEMVLPAHGQHFDALEFQTMQEK